MAITGQMLHRVFQCRTLDISSQSGAHTQLADPFNLGRLAFFEPKLPPGLHKVKLRPLSIFAAFKLRFELFPVARTLASESLQVQLSPCNVGYISSGTFIALHSADIWLSVLSQFYIFNMSFASSSSGERKGKCSEMEGEGRIGLRIQPT
jgi:hypothetical protein